MGVADDPRREQDWSGLVARCDRAFADPHQPDEQHYGEAGEPAHACDRPTADHRL